MRKRISALLVTVILAVCVLPGAAFAYGFVDSGLPQPDGYDYTWGIAPSVGSAAIVSGGVSTPVIYREPSAVYASRGDIPDALRVEATSYDGGALCYQWYMSYTGSFNDLFPISGATSAYYTPSQTLGTVFYCAGVYNVVGSARSSEVYTNLIPVTYSGIEIVNVPSKTSYNFGDKVDLSGLIVRVYDANGSYWESVNGSGLNVYPAALNTAGKVAVQVSYNGSSDGFYVNVNAAPAKTTKTVVDKNGNTVEVEVNVPTGPHEHEFGEWETTKPATCVTTGLETRICECGETETQEIARTDHVWDDGIITKEPTATSNGARLYTCTVCKANKSEIIPAGTVTNDIAEQEKSLNIDGGNQMTPASTYNNQLASPTPKLTKETVGTTATGTTTDTTAASGKVSNNGDSSGWWLIPASALLLVGTGAGAYGLMRKKNNTQQ